MSYFFSIEQSRRQASLKIVNRKIKHVLEQSFRASYWQLHGCHRRSQKVIWVPNRTAGPPPIPEVVASALGKPYVPSHGSRTTHGYSSCQGVFWKTPFCMAELNGGEPNQEKLTFMILQGSVTSMIDQKNHSQMILVVEGHLRPL